MTDTESTREKHPAQVPSRAASPTGTTLPSNPVESSALHAEDDVVELESIIELGPQAEVLRHTPETTSEAVTSEVIEQATPDSSPWPPQPEHIQTPVVDASIPTASSAQETPAHTDASATGFIPLASSAGGDGGNDDGTPPSIVSPEMPPVPQTPPPSDDAPEDEKPMSLLDHLGELRKRLMWSFVAVFICFLGCYHFAQAMFQYLAAPLLQVMPADSKFMFTGVAEGFFVELKVAFVAGIFVASPYLFYQIWAFISPGLYDEEKRYIIPLAFASALFFVGGAAFCYFGVFPFAFIFFLSYASDTIVAMLSISEYLSFTLKMLLAFGLVFEMPLFAFFLARMGIVTAQKMRSWRRYAVLAIFIIAAILTPPDVFSQLMMAGPMILLYEFSILVAAVAQKKKNPKRGEKEQPDDPDADAMHAGDNS